MSVNENLLSYLAIVSMLGFAGTAHADITGTIDVKIVLENGCLINGSNTTSSSSSANFGTIDFGTHTTLFDSANTQIVGGAGGITIQCTNGVGAHLVFKNGLHDGSGSGNGSGTGNKAMRHASDLTKHVTYHLLLSDNTTTLSSNHSIPLLNDGSLQTIVINGRAYGSTSLPAGVYSDTVTVVLEL